MFSGPAPGYSTFIEIVYLKEKAQLNKFCVKGYFFLESSEWQRSVRNTENVFGWQLISETITSNSITTTN